MGRRGIRVALIVAMLVVSLGNIGVVGAAVDPRSELDLSDFAFDGFGPAASNIKHFAPRPDDGRSMSGDVQVHRDEERHPQVIIGGDSRVQVTDTTAYPYSAVAQIVGFDENLPEDVVSACTATFVGPDVLITAAHCVWSSTDFGGWIDAIDIIPGANGDSQPFGVYAAQSVWRPEEFTTDERPGNPWDYALITIADTSVEDTVGSLSLGILTGAELQAADFNAVTSGYPGDKPFLTQWTGTEAAFFEVNSDFLIHEIDSVQGQSGSAVWRESDLAIVGIESWEDSQRNYATRLDLPIMYDLMGACQELGCRLNHFLTDVPGDGGAYDRVWQRTDLPVASGTDPRTWMWGPAPISKIMFEPYAEAPNGFRTVLYQEKSRMEITTPDADPNSIWYVTNGLATVELMTGNLQLGNDTFEQHAPAEINVAGDGNDPDGPTYMTFAGLQDNAPHADGSVITATVDRAGNVGDDPALASYGVTAAHFVPETGHMVASVFWEFMNSSGTVYQDGQYIQASLFDNAFFATGFPVTEPYWATVRVGGTERVVLVQAFERRVLTYTPGNPQGFEVEAGNVGSHYLQWLQAIQAADDPGGGGPTEPPVDQPPAIGELLGAFDFSTAPEIDLPFASAMPVGDEYHISNPPNGFLQILGDGSFGDGFFTVEARVVDPSATTGVTCIIYRADPVDDNPLLLESGYWFCLFSEGGYIVAAATVYETSQDIVTLGGVEFIEPLPVAGDWHRLGVIAQGSTFWFGLDDTLLGSLEHDLGPGSGQIGILTFNLDENESGPTATFAFRNLAVYALAGATEPPSDPSPPDPGDDVVTFGDGTYQVGTDIPPGTYRAANPTGLCYWERLSGFGGTLDEIIANEVGEYPMLVTISASDAGFSSSDCGTWTSDLSPITSSSTSAFGEGTFLVGVDVAPGTWTNSGGESCYWARLSGFGGTLDDIIANEFSSSPQIVTISPSDVGFVSSGCGTWTLSS